jgi:hypothetical protein
VAGDFEVVVFMGEHFAGHTVDWVREIRGVD